jgi:hypothetical protein
MTKSLQKAINRQVLWEKFFYGEMLAIIGFSLTIVLLLECAIFGGLAVDKFGLSVFASRIPNMLFFGILGVILFNALFKFGFFNMWKKINQQFRESYEGYVSQIYRASRGVADHYRD